MILELPKTCLIVDDTRSMRVMIHTWMTHAGLTCTITENGNEARSVIEKDCPDVLITDIEMPLFNGLELVCWVRQNPSFKIATLPIVVITSLDDPELEQIISDVGTPYLLRKPLSEETVQRTIRAAINDRQTGHNAFPAGKRTIDSQVNSSLIRQMAHDAMIHDFRNGTP